MWSLRVLKIDTSLSPFFRLDLVFFQSRDLDSWFGRLAIIIDATSLCTCDQPPNREETGILIIDEAFIVECWRNFHITKTLLISFSIRNPCIQEFALKLCPWDFTLKHTNPGKQKSLAML